ncbi:MAG: polysaccharide biosynthesis tyrosine autokinase [Caldilineaceae bacterium]|nr:polysaccharide biosynthesis tyrosine autokinase [Caldilineaceae bacterium]
MDDFVELRQILRMILRRWWILVIGVVIAGAIGYWISMLQTRVYAATTTVYVGRSIQSSSLERIDLQLGAQLALTYADLVRRKPVLKGAMDTLQLQGTWQGLRSRVDVSPVENTQLLEIRVSAASPIEAQMTADEIARQLILIGPMSAGEATEETRQFVQQRLDQLQTNIETAQRQVDDLEDKMAMLVSTAIDQLPELQVQVQMLETLIADWDSTYANLLASISAEPSANHLAIVESAEANPTPIYPRVQLNVLIAMIAGLFLSVGLAILLEYLDDTLKPADVVGGILGLGTLGSVSQIKGKTLQEKLILRQDLFSPASEDYRLLRNKFQVMCADWPRRIIMVTSPMPGELKSVTVANLGIVLAQGGFRVIIVDADMRQPVQHTLFQLPVRHGLTDLLYAPKMDVANQLQDTDVVGLQVLAVGTLPPPHPSELLGSARMGELLERLSEQADIVLCDSAYAVAIADALVLSAQVDGVVLAVEMGKTRRGIAEQAVQNLRQAGANLLGTILSPLPADRVATAKSKTLLVPGNASSTV